jgi:hypothetical protein
MKTPIRMQKAITYSIILLVLGGCNILNPIKDLECTILSASAKGASTSVGETERYTLNEKTGESYYIDELSGKLRLLNGKTSDIEGTYDERSLIVDNEWKTETIVTDTAQSQNWETPYKEEKTLNLKTMGITKKEYGYFNGYWVETNISKGKCEWVKPKTTEILQEPKT